MGFGPRPSLPQSAPRSWEHWRCSDWLHVSCTLSLGLTVCKVGTKQKEWSEISSPILTAAQVKNWLCGDQLPMTKFVPCQHQLNALVQQPSCLDELPPNRGGKARKKTDSRILDRLVKVHSVQDARVLCRAASEELKSALLFEGLRRGSLYK